jgi:hypothetical protein
MFFAIVDRDGHALTLMNGCIRLADAAGGLGGPQYFFSVSQSGLAQQPWRSGTVYLLPRATFTQQPPMAFGDIQVHIAQLASPLPVLPLARLTVSPQDFPFLAQVRGHEDERLAEYAAVLQSGAPWPEG